MANRFLNNISINDRYTLPSSDGSANQVLATNGIGELSFVDQTETAERIEVTVKNVSGGSLSKGTVVHASPSANPPNGNVIEVIAADYDDSTKMPAIGILNETIADEAEGSAVIMGAVSAIDTSGFSIGDELYVGNLGAFTNSKPATAGQLIQKIAVVIKSHASNGLIKIFGAGRSNDVPLPLYIDNANQRVGISEPSPDYKLHVNGQIYSESDNYPVYYLKRNTSATGGSFSTLTGIASAFKLETDSSGTITDGFGGGIIFSIGDTFPNTAARIYARRDGGDQTGALQFWGGVDGNTLFTTMRASGNVGIGTESPAEKLVVSETRSGTTAADQTKYTLVSRSTIASGTPGTGGIKVAYYDGANEHGFGLVAGPSSSDFLTSGTMHFYTNSDLNTHSATGYAMQLNNSGQLIIAGTNPITGSAKLSVAGETAISGNLGVGVTGSTGEKIDVSGTNAVIRLRNSETTEGTASGIVFGQAMSSEVASLTVDTSTDLKYIKGSRSSGTTQFIIKSGGNVGIGTSSPNTALEVDGAISTTTSDYVQGSTGSRLLLETSGSGNTHSYIQAQSGGGTSNAEDLALQLYGGNVGIGTSSPDTILEVVDENPILTVRDTSTGLSSANSALRLAESGSGDTLGNYWDLKMKPESVGGTTNFAIANSVLGEVLNINYQGKVGIGTTNPSEKLEVIGNAILDNNNAKIKIKAGVADTVGSIDFTFNTDSTQYGLIDLNYNSRASQGFRMKSLYPITLDAVTSQKFLINGSERMRIDSSGNVGIGTTNPSTKLHVYESNPLDHITIDGNNGDNRNLRFATENSTRWNLYATGTSETGSNVGSDLSIARYTDSGSYNGNVLMILRNSGYVGIGTSSPSFPLEVDGGTGNGVKIKAGNTSNDDSFLIANSSDTTLFVVDGGGQVGIGTSSPSGGKLHIYATNTPAKFESSTTGLFNTYKNSNGDFAYVGTGSQTVLGGSANDFGVQAVNNFVFATGGSTERMRIDSSGNVGIGTDAPDGLLHVSSGTSGDAILVIESDTDDSDNSDNPHLEFRQDGNTIRGKIGLEGTAGQTYSNSIANATYLGSVFQQPLQFITGDTGNVQTAKMTIQPNTGFVGIGTTSPSSKLQVDGAVQVADDTATASASKVGALRYRTSGNNSYVDMCMQTGASTYAWVNIIQNSW